MMAEEKFDSARLLVSIIRTKGIEHSHASNVAEAYGLAVRNRALQELRRRIYERAAPRLNPELLTSPANEELIWILAQIQELEAAS